MPTRLDAPVLTVDVGLIHKVDTRNVENLFSMWTVFSRCAGSLEEGRRLENLSWRLWNRETFCCDPHPAAAHSIPISSTSSEARYSHTDVPSLSGSIDSLENEEALDFDSDNTSSSTSGALDISHPHIRRQDSCHSSRGRESHLTPDDLEKMVRTIKEKKNLEPIQSTHPYLAPIPKHTPKPAEPEPRPEPQPPPQSQPQPSPAPVDSMSSNTSSQLSTQPASSNSTSGTSERSTTSVVRGFSPSHVSSSYRSIPLLTAPSSIPTADLAAAAAKATQPKKQQMFALGGSSGDDSMSEQTNSMESNLRPAPQQKKKNAIFSFGGSSNEEESSLPHRMRPQQTSALSQGIHRPLAQKKQTSFKEEVATRTIKEEQPFDDDVFESDEDEIDESAIDDEDDSSDWEDSIGESGEASVEDKTLFQRVDSRPNLTSRRSLITTMLHQNDRANALANAASRSTPAMQRSRNTSPNGPSLAASPDSDEGSALMMKPKQGLKPIAEVPRSGAQPIIKTTTNTMPRQMALSPRTTRRNMLATELTVSLRQHLLRERQQKSQTANAVLKRRHTAHDVANLKQYPEKVHMSVEDREGINTTWNQYFENGLGEYHSKGW